MKFTPFKPKINYDPIFVKRRVSSYGMRERLGALDSWFLTMFWIQLHHHVCQTDRNPIQRGGLNSKDQR